MGELAYRASTADWNCEQILNGVEGLSKHIVLTILVIETDIADIESDVDIQTWCLVLCSSLLQSSSR
jgi:hypothetical protein